MMMGLEFMGKEPFHTVYMHALVRDEKGAEDEQDQGQRHRPARAHRQLRRRRHPLHPGRDGRAGPRPAARDEPRRGLPQLRHQALERRALPRDERVRAASRVTTRSRSSSPLNRWIVGATARAVAAVTTRHRGLPLQRSRQRRLRLRLGHASATGTSSSPSPSSPARTRPRKTRPAPPPPGSSTRS